MKHCIKLLAIFMLSFAACDSTRPTQSGPANTGTLAGHWELIYMPASPEDINKLYPAKKPRLFFDTATRFSGHTGCNSLSGPLFVEGHNITFKEPMMMTKMACMNGMEGENMFLHTLKEVNSYIIKDSTLNLLHDSRALMQFVKRKDKN